MNATEYKQELGSISLPVDVDDEPQVVELSHETPVDENTTLMADAPVLPPYPEPLLEIPKEAIEKIQYRGEPRDVLSRLRHKTFLFWMVWASLRNDKRLIEIMNKHHDRQSDVFFVCNHVVNLLDQMARVLTLTDLIEELSQVEIEKDKTE